MNSLTKYEAERQQRSIDLNQATLELIQGSCFLSPEGHRHDMCLRLAESILGEHPSEDLIVAHPQFWAKFHCYGAAIVCTNCGSLIPPAETKCVECGNKIELRPAFLSEAGWHKAVVVLAGENIAELSLQVGQYLSGYLFAAGRMMALQGWLNVPEGKPDQLQSELRNTLYEMLADQDMQSWHHHFAADVAMFWAKVWPWLEQDGQMALEDTDRLTAKNIRDLCYLYNRMQKTDADRAEIAENVLGILDLGGDVRNVEVDGDPLPKVAYFTDNDLLASGILVCAPTGYWVLAQVREDWLPVAKQRYNWQEIDPDDVATTLGE